LAKTIKIVVSEQLYSRIVEISKTMNISVQDILIRAIVRALEDFEKIKKGGKG